MSFIWRLERNIAKLEINIEKEEDKIKDLHLKYEQHKIIRVEYIINKRRIENRIKFKNSRMRVLQEGLVKEKRHIDIKEEQKRKKREKKAKEKEEKRLREKAYFEWCEKNGGNT